MTGSREPTIWSAFGVLYRDDMRMRPVQLLVLAVLRLFKLDPLGYHVVNTALLAGAALCYPVCRALVSATARAWSRACAVRPVLICWPVSTSPNEIYSPTTAAARRRYRAS
jgi:hypothetical protein